MRLSNSEDYKFFLIGVVHKIGMLDWEPVTLPDGTQLSGDEFRLLVQDTLATIVKENGTALGAERAIVAFSHYATMDQVRNWYRFAVEMPAAASSFCARASSGLRM